MEVWAPAAERVELMVHGGRIPLRRSGNGWHRSSTNLPPGTSYAFSLDGGEPLPDPRSRHQPLGPFGPSQTIERRWGWTNRDWRAPPLADWVLYEMHVGTFTSGGTFDSAVERLDHLVDLGINAVELMPVAQGPGRWGWGYDCLNLYAVCTSYGGPDGLRRFVDGCHRRGISVVVDVVYNHLGPGGEYLGRFGPYFAAKKTTPWGPAFNFDEDDSDQVRSFLIDNALMWLREYRCDGLRLDAVHAIVDDSETHFLEQLAAGVDDLAFELDRPLFLIAESDLNDPRLIQSRDQGGFGVHAQWSDDFHHALHARLTGDRFGYYADFGSMGDIAVALKRAFVFVDRFSSFHNMVRGRDPAGLTGDRFLGYLQNHDMIGNRNRGDRASEYLSPGLLKIGSALVITAPFVPMMFQGEEWAATTPFPYFTDHADADLGRAVRFGRLREFEAFEWDWSEVPNPQARSTFGSAVLEWDELDEPEHRDILEWYRSLISLRRSQPALTDPDLRQISTDHDDSEGWLVVRRSSVTIACNLSAAKVRVGVPEKRRGALLMTSAEEPEIDNRSVILPPESVSIWLAT